MNDGPVIVWFHRDLRISDHGALHAAMKSGRAVVPVFIWAPEEEAPWEPGAASRWWLHRSLQSLKANLGELGLRLVVRRGESLSVLLELVEEVRGSAVYWNRRYEPGLVARDSIVVGALKERSIQVESFTGALMVEPDSVRSQAGTPFRVFTPFWKHCLRTIRPERPCPRPKATNCSAPLVDSLRIEDLGLEPAHAWGGKLASCWMPGERGATVQMKRFLRHTFSDYSAQRDRPDIESTSRLSASLHFGEVTPRQVWHALGKKLDKVVGRQWCASTYVSQLWWREFAFHTLHHFPHSADQPLRPEFSRFPWESDEVGFAAWKRGMTGFPIVDAGMRELWQTGWMHNRVRMVAASFLVKDLLVPWQQGARWFWDTLVDADLAQNAFGWQWVAGSGADAAPYFRVFNPILQGGKFDPDGVYTRRWCPELKNLPLKWLQCPWKAPSEVLHAAGVQLGGNYPSPIVDHGRARETALGAYAHLKQSA